MLHACTQCSTPIRASSSAPCPHCGHVPSARSSRVPTAIALVMTVGLATACYGVGPGDFKGDDTAAVDADADGYSVAQGDCNDASAAIHPGATETAGDGVDANCDGQDDT